MMAFSRGLLQSMKCEIKERVCWSFANIRDNGSQFSLVISFFFCCCSKSNSDRGSKEVNPNYKPNQSDAKPKPDHELGTHVFSRFCKFTYFYLVQCAHWHLALFSSDLIDRCGSK